MAGTAKKWLIGCGLGCGFVVALGLGLGAAGWYGVRQVAKRAQTLEAAGDSLATRFGAPEAYVPPLDGSLEPARIEAFLEVRRLMEPVRESTSQGLTAFEPGSGTSGPAKFLAGVKFIPQLLSFIEERDRALLAAGMGTGEYQYLYTVAFFGLLGRDPGDGPGYDLRRERDGDGGADWSFGTGSDSGHESGGDDAARREEVRRKRGEAVRKELNRVQRGNLAGQLAALDGATGAAGRGGHEAWRAALAAEVAALESEHRRYAWEQGLPEPTRAALEPFRDRLAASYNEMTGVLELRLDERE